MSKKKNKWNHQILHIISQHLFDYTQRISMMIFCHAVFFPSLKFLVPFIKWMWWLKRNASRTHPSNYTRIGINTIVSLFSQLPNFDIAWKFLLDHRYFPHSHLFEHLFAPSYFIVYLWNIIYSVHILLRNFFFQHLFHTQ